MSDIRQDPTTGRRVVIAPERGLRPNPGGAGPQAAYPPAPDFDPDCPFCPGNEKLLPGILEEIPCERAPGWLTRVVPNKYPALRAENGPMDESGDGGGVLPGYGIHEVIVEASRHNAELSRYGARRLAAVLATYRMRFADAMARPAIKAVMIFRNRGAGGGASLPHPHSQLIATPVVPPHLAEIAAWGRAHYRDHGSCATCDLIARELGDGRRVVEATERFVALVPFAAASPYEVWILPRHHQAAFAAFPEDGTGPLGALLRRTLGRVGTAAGNPPYTYAIQSAPVGHAEAPYFHWRLRIVPSLVTPGGFEIGGGLPINPSSPEGDAAALRSAEPAS